MKLYVCKVTLDSSREKNDKKRFRRPRSEEPHQTWLMCSSTGQDYNTHVATAAFASRLLARRRKDREPRASSPAQEQSSADDGSREFHLWA